MNEDDFFWNLILGNNPGGPPVTPFADSIGQAGASTNRSPGPQNAANAVDPSVGQSSVLGGNAMVGLLGPFPDTTASQSPLSSLPPDAESKEERGQKAMAALNAQMDRQRISGTVHPDFKEALSAWADAAQPIQQQYGTEMNSNIYLTRDGWQIGPAYSSGERTRTNIIPDIGIPPGGSYWGYIHTHPDNRGLDFPDEYTGKVRSDSAATHGFAYVALPNGQINGWAPGMPWTNALQGADPQFILRPPTSR